MTHEEIRDLAACVVETGALDWPIDVVEQRLALFARLLVTNTVDWGKLLQLLEAGTSGRLEFHVKDGRSRAAHFYVSL